MDLSYYQRELRTFSAAPATQHVAFARLAHKWPILAQQAQAGLGAMIHLAKHLDEEAKRTSQHARQAQKIADTQIHHAQQGHSIYHADTLLPLQMLYTALLNAESRRAVRTHKHSERIQNMCVTPLYEFHREAEQLLNTIVRVEQRKAQRVNALRSNAEKEKIESLKLWEQLLQTHKEIVDIEKAFMQQQAPAQASKPAVMRTGSKQADEKPAHPTSTKSGNAATTVAASSQPRHVLSDKIQRKLDKLRRLQSERRMKAATRFAKYEEALDQANVMTSKYDTEELPRLLTQLEELEGRRLSTITGIAHIYAKLRSDFQKELENISSVLATSLSRVKVQIPIALEIWCAARVSEYGEFSAKVAKESIQEYSLPCSPEVVKSGQWSSDHRMLISADEAEKAYIVARDAAAAAAAAAVHDDDVLEKKEGVLILAKSSLSHSAATAAGAGAAGPGKGKAKPEYSGHNRLFRLQGTALMIGVPMTGGEGEEAGGVAAPSNAAMTQKSDPESKCAESAEENSLKSMADAHPGREITDVDALLANMRDPVEEARFECLLDLNVSENAEEQGVCNSGKASKTTMATLSVLDAADEEAGGHAHAFKVSIGSSFVLLAADSSQNRKDWIDILSRSAIKAAGHTVPAMVKPREPASGAVDSAAADVNIVSPSIMKYVPNMYQATVQRIVSGDLETATQICELHALGRSKMSTGKVMTALLNVLELFSVASPKSSPDISLMLLRGVVEKEVSRAIDEQTMMRDNSVSSKLLSHFMRLEASGYLAATLQRVVQEAVLWPSLRDTSFEIDPARTSSKSDVKHNRKLLEEAMQLIIDRIVISLPLVPPRVRHIVQYMAAMVRTRFPVAVKSTTSRRKTTLMKFGASDKKNGVSMPPFSATAAVLFLRFICPTIMTARNWDWALHGRQDSALSRRNLVLVTKVLQNLANGVPFGSKEKFMKPLNDFISHNLPSVRKFCTALEAYDLGTEPLACPSPDAVVHRDIGTLPVEYSGAYIGRRIAELAAEDFEILLLATEELDSGAQEEKVASVTGPDSVPVPDAVNKEVDFQ